MGDLPRLDPPTQHRCAFADGGGAQSRHVHGLLRTRSRDQRCGPAKFRDHGGLHPPVATNSSDPPRARALLIPEPSVLSLGAHDATASPTYFVATAITLRDVSMRTLLSSRSRSAFSAVTSGFFASSRRRNSA